MSLRQEPAQTQWQAKGDFFTGAVVTFPFLRDFSTKRWEFCPNLGNDGSNTPFMLPKTASFIKFYQVTVGKGWLCCWQQSSAPHPEPSWLVPLECKWCKSLCRGENCLPWAQRSQGCSPSCSSDSQGVPEQPQFSPFTPVLLHLTGRTTGSDTDEFAKSKENNWIQQQKKGWVFRGLLEGTGGGGKMRRRERETLPWSSCSADSPQPSSFDISPNQGGDGAGKKMRFIKTDAFHYWKCKEADSTHSCLCQPGVPKYMGKEEKGRGNGKFHSSVWMLRPEGNTSPPSLTSPHNTRPLITLIKTSPEFPPQGTQLPINPS